MTKLDHIVTDPSVVIYLTTPTHTHTHTLLKLINKFSMVTGHKLNLQKSVSLLYMNSEQFENEVKKKSPSTVE